MLKLFMQCSKSCIKLFISRLQPIVIDICFLSFHFFMDLQLFCVFFDFGSIDWMGWSRPTWKRSRVSRERTSPSRCSGWPILAASTVCCCSVIRIRRIILSPFVNIVQIFNHIFINWDPDQLAKHSIQFFYKFLLQMHSPYGWLSFMIIIFDDLFQFDEFWVAVDEQRMHCK